jgi:hypothetical protein
MLCTNFPTSTAPCRKKINIGEILNDRLNAGKGKIPKRYVFTSVEVDDIMPEWEYVARNICAGTLFKVLYQAFRSKVNKAYRPICFSKWFTKIVSLQVKERL